MNMDCFLKQYLGVLTNDQGDSTFEGIGLFAGGTTGVRIGKLLNFAVSQMDDGECYVEVGTFTGGTLCQAVHMNYKPCIGIDSYRPEHMAEMTGMTADFIKERCKQNINCISKGKAALIEKDFRDVKPEEIPFKVAVSFIDGKHDYPSVIDNFKWLEPMLADDAVIVLDDINYVEVTMAIQDWISGHAQNYDMMSYLKPFYGPDGKNTWCARDRFLNNGVAVIRYHKDPRSNTFSYDPNKAGWTIDNIHAGKKL